MGEPGGGILVQRHVAQAGDPGEQPGLVIAALGDQVGDFAEPEHRHRDPDQPDHHQATVEQRAAGRRGDGADRDRDQHPEDRGTADQGQGDGRRMEHFGDHRLAMVDVGGEIAADEQPVHQLEILHRQRAVEPVGVTHRRHGLGAGVAAGDPCGRIGARRGEEYQEHQHADAEQHQHGLAEPLEQGFDHAVRIMESRDGWSRARRAHRAARRRAR